MISMGVHNLGYYTFWSRVFEKLRIEMSPALMRHLRQKDWKKVRKRKYETTPERKNKRAKRNHEKMKLELKKQIEDYRRGATYGSGIAIKAANCLPAYVLEDDQKKKALKSQRCPLIGCLGRNHSTSSSKACYYVGCRNNEEFLSKLKEYLLSNYAEKYGEYTM